MGGAALKETDRLKQEIKVLRERISKLSTASLRISASLDLDTVFNEIAESARTLTGARYCAIATIDESGEPVEFVTSGFTADEHRAMLEWADGPRLFEHLRDLEGPYRIDDWPSHVRALGFSPDRLPWGTFQGTPMRHRGVHVGNFYLAEKEGGEPFTDEDEEVLVLFASQAAAAIAHARAFEEERHARAGLEALVETSPVGVAVFDAQTGRPTSMNREARRIVEDLRLPGRPVLESLEVLTCRFVDGREIALEEFPLASLMGRAETVRAEEIELSIPDGRSVRVLVNATPIRSEEDAVSSVVVTMQDLKPLDDLERLRAEFLGMVSHELRAPLTAIKGSASTVLDAPLVPNPAEMLQFFRIINVQADHMRDLISNLLDAGRIDAGTLSVSPELSEVTALVDRARNTFLSSGGRHTVLIDLPPDLPRVMADRQRIVQVLNNLLSNAARNSPESSPIRIAAAREEAHVAISVTDEGRGVAPEVLPRLFEKRTGIDGEGGYAGTGLGLAICKGLVEAHGGRIRAESDGPGQGTCFTFTIAVAGEKGESAEDGSPGPPRETRTQARILVVDDDPQTLRFVRDALGAAGYATIVTGEAGELSRLIRVEKPHLVLLDLVLPETDGIELMETVPELAELPVIFISGYGRDETIARALEIGAVDYIVKPFSATELTARIGAALRRSAEPEPFLLGDMAIHYEQRLVTMAGRRVELTATEYELLRLLSMNAGRVVTNESLLRRVWGNHDSNDAKPVRTFVKQLRRKLGDDASRPAYILTERGVGYRMVRPGEPSTP